MDDSQHIFPIDLSEGKHKNPSPAKNSKSRFEKDSKEDPLHLKFFPDREKDEQQKNAPENKNHKKSEHKNPNTSDAPNQGHDSDTLDDVDKKVKAQDWKSGLVLGESDIIKKLYSSIPEAKVYEVG